MVEKGRGAIINVTSTSGFQPLPGSSTYAAAKAATLFHSEALGHEVKGTGVSVTAVCPGPVETEFQEASKPLFIDRLPKFAWVSAERVVADALHAAERGKRMVIPGGPAVRAFFAPNRMAPISVALPVAGKIMSKEVELGRDG
jgi:short-subunit dehydrogenase